EEPAEEIAGDDLALAAVVDVGRVEERDPALDRSTDDRLGLGLVERPLALAALPEAHHPEADARDAQPGAPEVHVLHRGTLTASRSVMPGTRPFSTIASLTQPPDLLVSDADRERVAAQLREHYEAGRLTLDEFQERLDEAHAARTGADLQHV